MKRFFSVLLLLSSLLASSLVTAQTVNSWVTNANQSALLQQQTAVNFAAGTGGTISINAGTTFQTVDGFGFCLTEGSAEAIATLNATQQTNLLNEFFSSSGMSCSVLRISIGASDLSSSSYSYDDAGPDPALNNFSLAGPDLTYLIPLVKRILLINPNIKVLATPWSAPRWMKTNNAWVGGALNTAYYSAYANYFVKYIQAMQAQGISIWAITPQNEPENPYNEPSMVMNAMEQTNFINSYLGPAFANAGISTKIIAFDHNLDNTAYPIQVANGSGYVDGSAFHLYAGNISGMTTVHNATNKNVYFTEQFTSTTGGFSGDFPWHMQNVMIGSMNNWSKTALEWNLATDAGFGPKTPGGCTTCLGAVTINNSSTFTRNVSYYIVAQMSKFVKPGAVRIQSSSSNGNLQNVAFKNPDGSIVLVVFNTGGASAFTVGTGSNLFTYTLSGSSAATFVWSNGPAPSSDVVTSYADCNYTGFSGGLPVGTYTLAQLNALGIADNSISSISLLEGYQAILYENDNFGGTFVTLTASNNCVGGFNDKTSSVVVKTNGATNMAGTYYLQNRNSGLFMDVWGATTNDGDNIVQGNYNGGLNQQYVFTHLGDGTYQVFAKHSNKSVDIAAISKADGANVQQWTYFGSANQQFIVVSSGGGFYKLIAKHSGKVVEVASAGMANGDNVQQWTNNGQTCGQWKFKPLSIPGTGNGLTCNYFNGMNFETPIYNRVDATVNFDWGNGTPNAAVNADLFSARWTGQIQPLYTDTYTFYLNSDNGRKLWINNVLVVDKWLDDWGTEYTGTIALTAGQKYDIRLEYFENSGGANCKMEWSSFYQDRQIVPQIQLYSNTLPTVSITAPANNALFVAPATVPITATAGDADGNVAKIDFYNGTTLIGTDNTAPFTFNWTSLTNGTYIIKALVTDNRGGVTLSSTITVLVNQAPTVTITSPVNNARLTVPATLAITATASDADGTINKVDFYNGATLLGTDNTAPYTYNWNVVAAGSYSITAITTDNQGATKTSTAVAVSVTNPIKEYTINKTFAPVTVDGVLDEAAWVSAPVTDNLLNMDGTTATQVTNAKMLWSDTHLYFAFTIQDNSMWATLTARDAALWTQDVLEVLIDKDGDAVNYTEMGFSPNENLYDLVMDKPYSAGGTGNTAWNINGLTVKTKITGTLNTATGGVQWVCEVALPFSGLPASPVSIVKPNIGDVWRLNIARADHNYNVAGSEKLYTWTYTDGVSNHVPSRFGRVTFGGATVNQLPAVAITSPVNNATFTAPATFTITATATDADGSITQVDFYNGSALLGSDNTAPYSYTWTGVAANVYSLTAVATDNQSGVTTSVAVPGKVVNPNQVPTVFISSPANNSTFTAPAAVTITASAYDPDGTIAKVEFYEGTNKLGEDLISPYSYAWTNVPQGSYALTAVVTDNEGAVVTSSIVNIMVNIATGVQQGNISEGITLYPNPSNNVVFITSQTDLSGASIKVIDLVGREVMAESVFKSELNVSGLDAGVYTLIIMKDENVVVKKLVVD